MLLPRLDRQQKVASQLPLFIVEGKHNKNDRMVEPSFGLPVVGHPVLSAFLSSLLLFSATPSLAITKVPASFPNYQTASLAIAATTASELYSTRLPIPSSTTPIPTTASTSPELIASFLLLWDEPKTGFAASYSQATITARQQLAKQQALQDERLAQCEASGDQFEQCFFYGTLPAAPESKTTTSDTTGQRSTPFLPPPREIIPAESTTANNQKTKGGIPTW